MASPLYKKALIVGATSGIGHDLARKFVEQGTKVIISGRREERLNEFISTYGNDKATSVVFDVTKLSEIPAFAAKVAEANPDLDCVVLNSGVQYHFDFTKPETVDYDRFNTELTTNYTSSVRLASEFAQHLRKQPKESHILFMSATLGLIPGLLRTGGYNASKGALHNFILVFRQQLKEAGIPVKLVEIFPPAVQTELHDAKNQPETVTGPKFGMPLAEFTEALYTKLGEGEDQVAIGPGGEGALKGFEKDRQVAFHGMVDMVNNMLKQFQK
jgi:short-subunit dehydrogenase involved in D-alanine esterification of teichoic acids